MVPISSDKLCMIFSIVPKVDSTIFSNGAKNHVLAGRVEAVKRMLDDSKITPNVNTVVRFCIE